jgi:hypothetical protein
MRHQPGDFSAMVLDGMSTMSLALGNLGPTPIPVREDGIGIRICTCTTSSAWAVQGQKRQACCMPQATIHEHLSKTPHKVDAKETPIYQARYAQKESPYTHKSKAQHGLLEVA